MKRYIKNSVPILASLDARSVEDLSVDEMLSIKQSYTLPDGNFGYFDSGRDFEIFTNILFKLEEAGYEI